MLIVPWEFNSTIAASTVVSLQEFGLLTHGQRLVSVCFLDELSTSLTDFIDYDMNEQYMPQIPSPPLNPSMLSVYDDPKFQPIYSRSLSSSPPRASLTPEQRELKRQRDVARRDSKTRVRRERSISNPYVVSNRTSPDLMSQTLPEYPNSLTPSPLLGNGPLPSLPPQSSPALSSSSYLTPYSPQINDSTGGQQDIYGPVFTMSPGDFSNSPTFQNLAYHTGRESNIHSYV
jgi:hypothetical protein